MSASLHPNKVHLRRHRKEKRRRLLAKLAQAPAVQRAAIEARIQRTYSVYGGVARPTS